ncbi:phosphatidylglycerol lysyltransferase domain-containing protein [Hoyosella sp. YIM 151337]|uniref:phosphatidylglycerol lysyltransferase domain-containing protein n=1 Tax=Hoyosella sp. YIM 151337 TaxID=2992742 RepID=UPI0022357604|nr:phosphatidylglycerol lysyltransferase domain-containing protein [Hoyosella sp. YIM 151337]MCW4353802.1 phosphatidylglycerol lysyltransferase domain-containing protein [Hoyosella sp. YIM 151337]
MTETLTAQPHPTLRRRRRIARRSAAFVVALFGVVNVVAAAAPHPRGTAPLAAEIAWEAVFGARYGLLAAGIVALLSVRGLLFGRRAAWLSAVAACVIAVAAHFANESGPLGFALAAAALLGLLVYPRGFAASSAPRSFRRGLAVLATGLLAVFMYALVGIRAARGAFRDEGTVFDSVSDAIALLLLLPPGAEPVTHHGVFIIDSARIGVLVVVVAGVALLAAAVVGRPGRSADLERVSAVLAKHGKTGLAHFHLLDDKNWVFSPDGDAFVGYAVTGTTAVALGEPVGERESALAAARAFLDLCDRNGWTPVFHQATPEGADLLAALGLKRLKIGEEAIIDVQSWSSDGRSYKSLRSALRRCERAGYRVAILPHPVTERDLARLREVSDAWLDDGGHRERTFTLGRFDPDYLRTTPVVVVVDDDDTIQAFANVLPSYQSEDGSFDLMRRRPGSANGVMDFLFVALIGRFKQAGKRGMNLGLAPLAGVGDPAQDDNAPSVADRVLRLIYERGDRFFNYGGLRAFKDKWQPRWEPRYLVYANEASLPKAALGVARIGELPDSHTWYRRIVSLVKRFPVSSAIIAVQLWLMLATAIDPRLHEALVRVFGLSWNDLVSGQAWRLVTDLFVQAVPGFPWSNAVLLVIFPLAEWRLGSRLVPIVFVGGDLLGTLPWLVTERVMVALGRFDAAVLSDRDVGLSSGAYALLAVTLCTLPWRRIRFAAVGALLGGLTVVLVLYQRDFDWQHLLSTTLTVAVYAAYRWRIERRRRTRHTADVLS